MSKGSETAARKLEEKLLTMKCVEVCIDPTTGQTVLQPTPGAACPPGTVRKLISSLKTKGVSVRGFRWEPLEDDK